MEKPEPNAHPLTLADWGDYPSTVGGSSVATATAAGIAALVWSKYPTWSASMVRDKLIQSSMNYPYRNAQLGWGLMNAEKATR
jgi:subtilisin family serine protease